jgi:heat shock protein beta
MKTTKKFQLIAVLALALAGMAIVVGSASAHRGHGDRQARIDSDRDSASNRCETQAGLDSTKTDTDGNGTIDGLEDSDADGANNAAESRLRTNCSVKNTRFKLKKATVKSYSAEDGLTLAIGKRGLITAAVSTNVVCEQDDVSDDSSDDNSASVSRDGEDDDGDDRSDDSDRRESDDDGDDDRGSGDDDRGSDDRRSSSDDDARRGRDDDDDDTVACTTAALVEGTDVKSAKIKNGVFTKIRLAAADEGNF